MKLFFTLVAAVLLLSLINSGIYGQRHDPSYKWQTITTENFHVHFHDENRPSAVRIAEIAEKYHPPLAAAAGWEPRSRTHIVAVDSSDLANGWAAPFPRNTITIYLSRPFPDSTLAAFDDFLEIIFIHEYTHILNIDAADGFIAATRYFPGRILFPNLHLPVWALEGSAINFESIYTELGRNNSTYTDMIFRIEIYENNFKNISQASHFPRDWPRGYVPYLYGGKFVEFIEKKYGEGAFTDYMLKNSGSFPYADTACFIPRFHNSHARNLYEKTFDMLWDEWKDEIISGYRSQIEEIKQKGITSAEPVSAPASDSSLPVFSKDGRSIYYIESEERGPRKLVRYSLDDSSTYEMCEVNYPSDISVLSDREILVADIDFHRSFSLFSNLFIYDSRNYKNTGKALRATHFDYSEKSGIMIYTYISRNMYNLTTIDKDGIRRDIIKNSDAQITFPALSRDGSRAAFVIKDSSGSDLVIHDLDTENFIRLRTAGSNDIHPAFTPDGENILFSSDRDGVFNIYEYNISEHRVRQLTNFIGGGFHPVSSPDMTEIAFTYYGSNGGTISLTGYNQQDESTVSPPEKELIDTAFLYPEQTDIPFEYREKKYSPVSSIAPPFIIPLVATAEIYPDAYEWIFGFYTMGYDVLQRHFYQINALARHQSKYAEIEFLYSYRGFYPEIIFGYYDSTLFFDDDPFPWPDSHKSSIQREMERHVFAAVTLPRIRFNSYSAVTFFLSADREITDQWYYSEETHIVYKHNYIRPGILLNFDSSNMYTYSVIPESGRTVSGTFHTYHEEHERDIVFYKAEADYSEYLRAPGRSAAFMFRAKKSYSKLNTNYSPPYNLGRFKRGPSGTPDYSSGIRGYPAGYIYAYRFASATIEYHLPLFQRDAGYGIFPALFRDFWIAFFGEGANLWDEKFHADENRFSAGVELHLRLTAGYHFDIEAHAGYARGFNDGGENQFYFGLGTLVEGAIKKRP